MESGVIVRAFSNFASNIEGELSLKIGTILQVIRPVNQYWSYGCTDGFYGNFPSSYVTQIQLPNSVVSAVSGSSQAQLFVAKERCTTNKSHEMSFGKGDIILGLEDLDGNWWRGRLIDDCDNSKIKVFPIKLTWKVDMALLKLRLNVSKTVEMKGRVNMSIKAQLDEEIDLIKDDIVYITEIVDDDWYRGHCNGNTGIFPASIVTLLNELEKCETDSGSSSRPSSSLDLLDPFSLCGFNLPQSTVTLREHSSNSSINCNTNSQSNVEMLLTRVDRNLPYAQALYTFRGEYYNELTFEEGELIQLTRRISEDWLEGETSAGKKGLFPKCYVHIVIDLPEEMVNIKTVPDQPEMPFELEEEQMMPLESEREKLVALYDFYPEVEGDVPVMEGERVILIERPDKNWCKVRNGVGLVGLCPASYLQPWADDSKQWLQRHWSLPAHLLRSDTPYLESVEDLSTRVTHLLNGAQPSVNSNCQNVQRVPSDSMSTSSPHRTSFSSELRKMSPVRPPPPDIIKNIQSDVDDRSQKSTTQARVYRPAPAPPTNARNTPRRSLSAVGNCYSRVAEERRSLQLRHTKQARRSQKRGGSVVMSDITMSGTVDPAITEISSDGSEVELGNRCRSGSVDSSTRASMLDQKMRERNKRDMIIAELMKTERDYINDMEYCKKNFMTNPEEEKRNGLDVDILFGHLNPVITVSKKLLKSLEAISSQPTEHKQVGNCFLEIAPEMREAYDKYCFDHDEVIHLLKRYEEDRSLSLYIRQKLESGGCANNQVFIDLRSLVIKPIQRITKYPLLLGELVHVTEETSNDYSELIAARHTMTDVANAINESKRKKDLVLKYRKDGDTSLQSKLAKISLHSVAKKSGRIGIRLSSSLGLFSVHKDKAFDEEDQKFRELDKSIKQLLTNIHAFILVSEENIKARLRLVERISDFYDEERAQKVVDNFRTVQRVIAGSHWPDFQRVIERRVYEPLAMLQRMFEGPSNLIEKRNDKLLDYDRASQRMEKNKDANCTNALREELEMTKKNYMALNNQLLEELPKLTQLATEILAQCMGAFIQARSKFMYKSATQLVELAETTPNLASSADVLDSFFESHRVILNRMVSTGLIPPDSHLLPDDESVKTSSVNKLKAEVSIFEPQSSSQKAYLQGRYQPNQLYIANSSYPGDDKVEVSISEGDIVAVLIQRDPMGNSERWFVDNGSSKGLVPAKFLSPLKTGAESVEVGHKQKGAEAVDGGHKQKEAEQSFAVATKNNPQTLMPPSYDEACSGNSSPIYNELDDTYESLNDDSVNHYYEVVDISDAGERCSPTRLRSASSPNFNASTTQHYEAAYEFRACGENELGLARGQVVLILCKQDMEGNQEWWLARDRYGREGYVPGNYMIPHNS